MDDYGDGDAVAAEFGFGGAGVLSEGWRGESEGEKRRQDREKRMRAEGLAPALGSANDDEGAWGENAEAAVHDHSRRMVGG
jgi:hypothetical protein